MKANIPMRRPVILGVGLQEETVSSLAKLCWEDGIEFRRIGEDQLGKKLIDLAVGTAEKAGWTGKAPAREAMIFCFMEQKVLYYFLDQMKAAGVSVELKAMMTPTSQNWLLGDLLCELEEEHLAMTARQK